MLQSLQFSALIHKNPALNTNEPEWAFYLRLSLLLLSDEGRVKKKTGKTIRPKGLPRFNEAGGGECDTRVKAFSFSLLEAGNFLAVIKQAAVVKRCL